MWLDHCKPRLLAAESPIMNSTVTILIVSVLWLLMCLRFWSMISRENVWQRRLIAIAGGLGAGLIYILGTQVWGVLTKPSPDDMRPIEAAEDIRISPKS
jgi:hypothetical protein